MAYLDFLTVSGNATGTQADLNLTDIWWKVAFDGAMIANMGIYDINTIFQIAGTGTQQFELGVAKPAAGFGDNTNFYTFFGTNNNTLNILDSNFVAGNFYIWYGFVDDTGYDYRQAVYEADGTLIADKDALPYDTLDIGGGDVTLGWISEGVGGTANDSVPLDALAIYSAAPASETAEPSASDPNILAYWPINEDSGTTVGNEVAGGSSLTLQGVEGTDWDWAVGGIWDAGAGGGGLSIPVAMHHYRQQG